MDGSASKVVLKCLPPKSGVLAAEIRQRGNVPLSICDRAILELTPQDISQSWTAASKLSAQKAAALAWRLADAIASDEDLPDQGADAAALFFLALRHEHADLKRALCGCRITWTGNASAEKLEYLV